MDTLGEAPRCSRVLTMGRCPMKAATCRGVRPDCEEKEARNQDGTYGLGNISYCPLLLLPRAGLNRGKI